ncbi:MAG: hypothetical protein SOT76_05950, partial [Eubacteriales bacterium]|nr:hypothetical protein [Eubacteriales bacterium]
MKKVLATLLAVLLLTCVFATAAMAAQYTPNKKMGTYYYFDGLEWKKYDTRSARVTIDSESDELYQKYGRDANKWLSFVKANYGVKLSKSLLQPNETYECDGGHWEVASDSTDTNMKFKWYCDATNGNEQH